MARTGTLFITAPSGTGKSTLIKEAIQRRPEQRKLSVSHTSRLPREGEENGREYYFTSEDDFQQRIQNDEFIEWAEVFGNFYGTSKKAIQEQLQQGFDLFLDIDWQGAEQIKKVIPEVVTIYILPPSKDILYGRLQGRGQMPQMSSNIACKKR